MSASCPYPVLKTLTSLQLPKKILISSFRAVFIYTTSLDLTHKNTLNYILLTLTDEEIKRFNRLEIK